MTQPALIVHGASCCVDLRFRLGICQLSLPLVATVPVYLNPFGIEISKMSDIKSFFHQWCVKQKKEPQFDVRPTGEFERLTRAYA